jgi:drug/metabolite transporter (DMT)-like permease
LNRQFVIGVAASLAVVCFWSGWMVVSRLGVGASLTIYDVAGLRFGVGALVVTPFVIKMRLWRGLTPFRVLVLGCGAGVPYALLCYAGFVFAPVAHAGVFINGCLPIFTPLVAWLWVRHTSQASQVVGMLLILIGATLVGYEGFMNQHGEQTWIGDALFLSAAGCFSIYMVASKVWQITPGQTIFTVTTMSGLVYVPIWLLFLDSSLATAPMSEMVLQGAYQGLIASIGGICCMAISIRNLGANMASAFMPVVPVVSTLMAIPLLDEMPGTPAWIGMFLVTIGVFLALGLLAYRRTAHIPA